MPNNKLIALFMLIAAAAAFIYNYVTKKKDGAAKSTGGEEPADAEIIPIGPRLAMKKAKLDDDFYPLDDIDLMFLRVCKDGEGTVVNYSFDFLRNHDTHYVVSCESMDKIMNYFDEASEQEYTVDALREYLADSGEEALKQLFDKLEINYTFREAAPDAENPERTDNG